MFWQCSASPELCKRNYVKNNNLFFLVYSNYLFSVTLSWGLLSWGVAFILGPLTSRTFLYFFYCVYLFLFQKCFWRKSQFLHLLLSYLPLWQLHAWPLDTEEDNAINEIRLHSPVVVIPFAHEFDTLQAEIFVRENISLYHFKYVCNVLQGTLLRTLFRIPKRSENEEMIDEKATKITLTQKYIYLTIFSL